MPIEAEPGPQSFEGILAADDPPPVLVGGQAVNLWALWAFASAKDGFAGGPLAELATFKPFTSKDCDVRGDSELIRRLEAKSGWRGKVFERGPTCAIGYLQSPHDDGLIVEVLDSVRGLGRNLAGQDITITWEQSSYRVLNPLALLQAKLANAVEIPQNGRQDVKHVRMLILIVRIYVAATLAAVETGEEAFGTLKGMLRRLEEIATGGHARKTAGAHAIDFGACYPWEAFEASSLESVRLFVKHQKGRLDKLLGRARMEG